MRKKKEEANSSQSEANSSNVISQPNNINDNSATPTPHPAKTEEQAPSTGFQKMTVSHLVFPPVDPVNEANPPAEEVPDDLNLGDFIRVTIPNFIRRRRNIDTNIRSSQEQPSFSDSPVTILNEYPDILVTVFSFLDRLIDLIHVSQVCHAWERVCMKQTRLPILNVFASYSHAAVMLYQINDLRVKIESKKR